MQELVGAHWLLGFVLFVRAAHWCPQLESGLWFTPTCAADAVRWSQHLRGAEHADVR